MRGRQRISEEGISAQGARTACARHQEKAGMQEFSVPFQEVLSQYKPELPVATAVVSNEAHTRTATWGFGCDLSLWHGLPGDFTTAAVTGRVEECVRV